METVSVFIPVYNAEKYIEQAIASVLNQTISNWELIILDDASSDQSYTICKTYEERDKRIKVFRNDHNLGMVANWNKGIALCKNKYFVKLDADDIWHPRMLEKSIQIMEASPQVGLVFTRYVNINSKGELVKDSEIVLPEFAADKPFSCVPLVKMGTEKMLQFSILRQGLSLLRRSIFDDIGTYRYLLSSDTQASSDTEFYFRVGCHYSIYCINEVYYYYRIHSNSISSLDSDHMLQDKKMFEVKMAINNYYFEQGKISRHDWLSNRSESEFNYQTSLVYQNRAVGKWLFSFYYLIKNLISAPVKTIDFYSTRIRSKFESK